MSTPIGSSQWMYATGAEVTQQSLKFNDDESQYLSWTPAAAGNRKTWTWSGWVKRGNLTGADQFIFSGNNGSTNFSSLYFNNSNNLAYYDYVSGTVNSATTSAVFRDTSAWYHIVLYYDTTQATSTDRIKIYVNGEQQSVSASYPSLNYDSFINSSSYTNYLASQTGGASYLDGYLSDVYFIDGQALAPTSFGQFTNGYWEKIDYAGSYGTNGFHLTFQDDVVSEGFNAVTYRGNGTSQSVSGLGLSPDLVWIKDRNTTGLGNILFDSVRGDGKYLFSTDTSAEGSASGILDSFDADGFTIGSNGHVNNSGDGFVAWCWDAGSGSPVSNTDGSITSTVKANPSYGFSIVSYTGNATAGATVGHGLSSAPEMVILKCRNQSATVWPVYHSALGATKGLYLNYTSAENTFSGYWNDTAPTASVFSLGNWGIDNNGSGDTYIAYCFHSVAGYSKISSYSGTGASGNAVTGLGFKPAFLMVKRTDSTSNWAMYDNTRSTTNPRRKNVWANLSDFEYDNSAYDIDFDADGFTLQTSDSQRNASGGTYIYMAFADTREAAFWKDVSGQGNHWTPNNLDYRDSLIDSPANNFATLNPLHKRLDGTVTMSEGNLQIFAGASYGGDNRFAGTTGVSSGKWYFEMLRTDATGLGNQTATGVFDADTNLSSGQYSGNPTNSGGATNEWALTDRGVAVNGSTYTNLSGTIGTVTQNKVVQVAVDMDNKKIWFGIDNTFSGDPAAGSGEAFSNLPSTILPLLYTAQSTQVFNFGQDSTFSGARPAGGNQDDNGIGDFAYAPPSGYLALCTANLPTPTIVDGSEYFNTVLFTGNNADRNIDVGFKSDFVWLKHRNDASAHRLYDSLRGDGKTLFSNLANAEYNGVDDGVEFAYADGFNIDVGANVYNYNGSSQTYATWNWKAGGAAVSNTDGSITSQVSANVDAGFSIVSYTGNGTSGATIGHSLGVKPDMIIFKDRDSAQTWTTYHSSLGATKLIFLNRTDAFYTEPWLNNTEPTSSVITLSTYSDVNTSGDNYIAYCFADVEGFSKAGSYTGNGSTDGPFVYTGFRPRWLMIKRIDTGGYGWNIYDTSRSTYNQAQQFLQANSASAETNNSAYAFDILSNGYKARNTDGLINGSGGTYIYLAFAEHPFKYANAR